MKLTDKIPSAAHRVLVFGPPKSGKTQLVGKLAKHFKLIWFDLENGYATLMKLPKEAKDNIEIISIPDTKVLPIAIETMLKVVTGNKCIICDMHGKIACPICTKDNNSTVTVQLNGLPLDTIIVVDSLTQLTNSAISNISRGKPDDFKFEWPEWSHLKNIVDKFLSQIQQANYNIVCISHEDEVEMEDKRKKLVPVCGSSNSSRNSAKYFDHVVYCDVKNKKHGAASSTTYMNNILTGSRTDVVLENKEQPSLLDIFDSKEQQPATPGQLAMNQLKGVVAK